MAVSCFCTAITLAPFPGVFYVNYQSLHRWDFMECSSHAFPSAQELVQEPILWFSCTACDFQYIAVTLPWPDFTIPTSSKLMARRKVVIKQRKIQATVQNFAYVHFINNLDCLLNVRRSLCFIQTSCFSKLCGPFVCLIAIHEASTQIPVAALKVLINVITFSLQAGVFKYHDELILQNSTQNCTENKYQDSE